MMWLVIGGASSGKSAWAERLLQATGAMPHLYVATLEPRDQEDVKRIERHHRLRLNRGFETVECYGDLKDALIPQGASVLVESAGMALSNSLFARLEADMLVEEAVREAGDSLLRTFMRLNEESESLVVVSEDIFGEPAPLDELSRRYRNVLGFINASLASAACGVIEVVCGLPIIHKGSLPSSVIAEERCDAY